MPPTRLLLVAPCMVALVCAGSAAIAAKQDGRHAGHLPRLSTATYTRPAQSHHRVLRMAGVHGTRYAQDHRHGLMRGS